LLAVELQVNKNDEELSNCKRRVQQSRWKGQEEAEKLDCREELRSSHASSSVYSPSPSPFYFSFSSFRVNVWLDPIRSDRIGCCGYDADGTQLEPSMLRQKPVGPLVPWGTRQSWHMALTMVSTLLSDSLSPSRSSFPSSPMPISTKYCPFYYLCFLKEKINYCVLIGFFSV